MPLSSPPCWSYHLSPLILNLSPICLPEAMLTYTCYTEYTHFKRPDALQDGKRAANVSWQMGGKNRKKTFTLNPSSAFTGTAASPSGSWCTHLDFKLPFRELNKQADVRNYSTAGKHSSLVCCMARGELGNIIVVKFEILYLNRMLWYKTIDFSDHLLP